jgi:hypothetical protein
VTRLHQATREERAETVEAFEERAAIIEEGAKVDRLTAEVWAAACLERVPGAVRFVPLLRPRSRP